MQQINIKRPEFGILTSCTGICSRMKRNFMGFCRMNIEQFYRLSQLVGQEIQKQNTNYKRAISPEEDHSFVEERGIKICRRQERDSRYY